MRRIVLGVLAAVGLAGAAQAADFVVVASTDPAIPRGREVDAGERLPLGAGKTLVVIDTAGQVTRLTGSDAGATAPRRQQLASVNAEKMAILKMLVAQPRTRRGAALEKPACPDAASLTSLDPILAAAQVDGCLSTARGAFETYVQTALGPAT